MMISLIPLLTSLLLLMHFNPLKSLSQVSHCVTGNIESKLAALSSETYEDELLYTEQCLLMTNTTNYDNTLIGSN